MLTKFWSKLASKTFLLFIAILSITVKAQTIENTKVIKQIPHKAKDFTTDRLGNSYLFNHHNIWLYNSNGDSIASFNSRKYGDITSVDATDPYKILVFFNNYNLIIFLDNYLSINGDPVQLETLGFDQISMACTSRGDGIWIFDAIKQKAIHLNEKFKADKESVNLSQWLGARIEPNFMLEYNNQLFINEEESGIYQFDHFATYLKKIPIIGLNSFQRVNEQLHYFQKTDFCEYNTATFDKACYQLPYSNALNFRIEKNRQFLFSEKSLTIFSTK